MSNNPYKKLASLIEQQMFGHAARAVSGVPCELGTITAIGLKLDSLKYEIPDYMVADWVINMELPAFEMTGMATGLIDSEGGAVTGQATFSFQQTLINEIHVDFKACLQAGDRVLAVPVNGGQDFVVIAKVIANE